jgi:glyoxylase-like metal-dependent hydrolase (beta-lactamase superfamily II)
VSAALEFLPWEPPAIGAGVAIEPQLRWLRLPLPGSLAHINVWLAAARDGQVLIDTGMNLPDTHAAWERLAQSEHLAQQLRAIVVTHHHPDHFGMAAHLSERYQVPVRMSAPAREAAARDLAGMAGSPPGALEEYQHTWGVSFQALVSQARAEGVFEKMVSGMPARTQYLEEGERPAELRDPWQASVHFGHAEGHVCLHWPQAALLISGDQLLPRISSNISLYPGVDRPDPLGDYLFSLERLALLPADTVVLPAHGQPFRGAAVRATQLRDGHMQRLARLTDFTAQPRTTAAIVTELFGGRNLEGWNNLLAYGETLAHVRYLHLRGTLTRLAAAGAVHWVRS